MENTVNSTPEQQDKMAIPDEALNDVSGGKMTMAVGIETLEKKNPGQSIETAQLPSKPATPPIARQL